MNNAEESSLDGFQNFSELKKEIEILQSDEHNYNSAKLEKEAELRYIQAQKKRLEISTNRKIRISLLIFIGSISIVAGVYSPAVLIDKWPLVIGAASLFYALVIALLNSASKNFLDIDRDRFLFNSTSPSAAWPFSTGLKSKEDDSHDESEDVETEFNEIRSHLEKLNRSRIEGDSFGAYFFDLKKTLERKADDADAKASILLDKGTGYTKLGIWFFLISIITWQTIFIYKGFQTHFIYGIVSCSGLFIFIEFLSAWFLRQYRHYVDTSTYLLRVKAIFDRYMLVYLATKVDGTNASEDQQYRSKMLLELLSREISWPETYLQKKQDTGFAKDAIEAISLLTKELRTKQDRMLSKSSKN